MSKKTSKNLDSEYSNLKNLFVDMQEKFKALNDKHEELEKKYGVLEKKYDDVISKKSNVFRCDECEETFTTLTNLGKHRKSHQPSIWSYPCDDCEKVFNEEWKLNAHAKKHTKYRCEICEKTFKYEDAKAKHNKIVHENMKLYCHYFNNGKNCPFAKECVFIHEVSDKCKYGKVCEREMCTFRHNGNVGEVIDDETEEDTEQNITFLKCSDMTAMLTKF